MHIGLATIVAPRRKKTGSGKSLYITPTIPNRFRDGQAIMEVIIWGMWGNKQERRKHRRLRVDISIEARIVDICESGILVETSLMLKKGTFITVTIDGLQFTAIVRHETGGSKGDFRGFGAEFQMLTAEHNDKIRKNYDSQSGGERGRNYSDKRTFINDHSG